MQYNLATCHCLIFPHYKQSLRGNVKFLCGLCSDLLLWGLLTSSAVLGGMLRLSGKLSSGVEPRSCFPSSLAILPAASTNKKKKINKHCIPLEENICGVRYINKDLTGPVTVINRKDPDKYRMAKCLGLGITFYPKFLLKICRSFVI